MAILRWLLFHWSAMTWFLRMDTRLRLGRERFERVVTSVSSRVVKFRLVYQESGVSQVDRPCTGNRG
jgi:hypothetical protein